MNNSHIALLTEHKDTPSKHFETPTKEVLQPRKYQRIISNSEAFTIIMSYQGFGSRNLKTVCSKLFYAPQEYPHIDHI